MLMKTCSYIVPLREVGINDIEWVGGKNASLGEMIQHLTPLGISIPDGFVVTVHAYKQFLLSNDLEPSIKIFMDEIDFENLESLRKGGKKIRQLIRNTKFPKEISEQIIAAYYRLSEESESRHPRYCPDPNYSG